MISLSPLFLASRRCGAGFGAFLAFSLFLLAAPPSARAANPDCRARLAGMHGPAITLRIDNDLFGRKDQDEGYSNGLLVTAKSPNLLDYRHDPCLPRVARWVNRYLEWLHPGGFEEQNMVFSFGQALFTPGDDQATELLPKDRPYAAALLASFGYNARQGNDLRSTHLRIGVVGPSAFGEEVQNTWHDLIGVDRFRGWKNQLHDELVVQIVKEKMRRYGQDPKKTSSPWGQDLIVHWGGALGNFATFANLGAEWRFGYKLPDDFGSTPLRPAGENTAPSKRPPESGWTAHVFATTDGRWVLHDITLDGNTFGESHSVEKKPFVGDVGYGLAVTYGPWKLAFARYFRSNEFEGQEARPVFGSFTISRRF